jgi:PEGA domain
MEHEFRGKGPGRSRVSRVSSSFLHYAALAWVALSIWAVHPTTVHANTAVVVPPSIDMTAPADVLDTAATELMRLIRVQGFDVISPGQASAAAEDAQASGTFPAQFNVLDCRSVECAIEYRRLFDASFAAQLFVSGLSGKVSTVTVTITESANVTFTGTAPLQGGDMKAAVQVAYGAARDKYVRGEGPWLTVAGGPAGAQVIVDGQEYGTLPIEHRYLAPGAHQLEVRADGHTAQKLSLEIPAQIDHEERLNVTLLALGDAQKKHKLDRTWDYVTGGLIAAVGAAHLALGAYQFKKSGSCVDTDCTRVYGDDSGKSQEKLLMGLGAAGVAAGALWMGIGPIARLSVRADAHAASLNLRGAF